MPDEPEWVNPYQKNRYTGELLATAGDHRLQAYRTTRADGAPELRWRVLGGAPRTWWGEEARRWADQLLDAGLIELTKGPHKTDWVTAFVTPAGHALVQTWQEHPFNVIDAGIFDVARLDSAISGWSDGVEVLVTHPGSDTPTEVSLFLRHDGSLGIQVDTATDRAEDRRGPIGYVLMLNDADLYRNPVKPETE